MEIRKGNSLSKPIPLAYMIINLSSLTNFQFSIFNYLEYSLCHHSLSYLHEAGYVGAFHVVYVTILLLSVFYALLVDTFHDTLKFLVYFLAAPA